jgi:O-antigen ligase
MHGIQFAYERYSASGFDMNELGVALVVSTVWAAYLAASSKGLIACTLWAHIIIALIAVALTASRTAVVASSLAVLYIILRESRVTKVLTSITITAVLLLTVVYCIPETSRSRIGSTFDSLVHGELSERPVVWREGLQQFREHPILGVGAGAFGAAVQPALKTDFAAHNSFLSVLVEAGFVTFCAFVVIVVLAVHSAARFPKAQRKMWLATLAVWASGAATLTLEYRKLTWMIFALIIVQYRVTRRSQALAATQLVCAAQPTCRQNSTAGE